MARYILPGRALLIKPAKRVVIQMHPALLITVASVVKLFDMNKPYVKIYDNGILTNPITKHKGYVTTSENRKSRRQNPGRSFSNKKGIQLVVTKIGPLSFHKSIKIIHHTENGVFVQHQDR